VHSHVSLYLYVLLLFALMGLAIGVLSVFLSFLLSSSLSIYPCSRRWCLYTASQVSYLVMVSHFPSIGVKGFLKRGFLERQGQGRARLSRRLYSLVGSYRESLVSLFYLQSVDVFGCTSTWFLWLPWLYEFLLLNKPLASLCEGLIGV